jgi:hypothetical protein
MIAALWRVRSCDSRRLPISGPIGKKLQSGCAGPLRCSAADFAAFAAKRLNDARAWLAKTITGKRASHPSRQDKQEPIWPRPNFRWLRAGIVAAGPAAIVTKLSPLGRRSGAHKPPPAKAAIGAQFRGPRAHEARRALQQIEDPARRTRSAAQRRRGSRLVGIRSRSARSTTVHPNHSQPIANHSRSLVRSRHYRREGNSKRAVRRAQKPPPGRR